MNPPTKDFFYWSPGQLVLCQNVYEYLSLLGKVRYAVGVGRQINLLGTYPELYHHSMSLFNTLAAPSRILILTIRRLPLGHAVRMHLDFPRG